MVQQVNVMSLELAYVDIGYTAEKEAAGGVGYGIESKIVKLREAMYGFVVLSW